MDSDIILKDDGTAEITGDNLKVNVSDMALYYRGGHITSDNGSLEISSDAKTVKTTCSDYALYYRGGHITSDNGNLEISSDAKTVKTTCTDYALYYRGGHITSDNGSLDISANTVKVGSLTGGKFVGLSFTSYGLNCQVPALTLQNPSVVKPDSQPRLALMQSASDELVLNAASHYTGGVKVEGKLTLAQETVVPGQLTVGVAGKLLLSRPDKVVKAPGGRGQIHLPSDPIDVLQVITSLEAKVAELTQRLAELEARVH